MSEWTEDALKLLRKYWTEGLSASQIAGLLPGKFSRSAVCGKARRLHLYMRKDPSLPNKPAKPKGGPTYLPNKRRPTLKASLPVTKEQPLVHSPVAPVPTNKRKRQYLWRIFYNKDFFQDWMIYLKPRKTDIQRIPGPFECKWITGEVQSPKAYWCREHVVEGKSWCKEHLKRAYEPRSK